MNQNIYELINNVTGGLNMNINFGNGSNGRNSQMFQNNSSDYSYYDEEDEDNSQSDPEQNQEELNEEAYRELILKKRNEFIIELNQFEYKNVDRFMSRKDE